jgi:hypothetical protein
MGEGREARMAEGQLVCAACQRSNACVSAINAHEATRERAGSRGAPLLSKSSMLSAAALKTWAAVREASNRAKRRRESESESESERARVRERERERERDYKASQRANQEHRRSNRECRGCAPTPGAMAAGKSMYVASLTSSMEYTGSPGP